MAVHPEANAVDILYLDNKAPVPMVQCMGSASSDSGLADLHEPTPPMAKDDLIPSGERDIYAVVGCVGGLPIVLGFLAPQVSQVLFKGRSNFRVYRHPSDVYSTLDDAGNFTMAWPNGTFLKIGADPTNEDLSGKDFDAKWAISRNKTAALHVQLSLAGSDGSVKASLHVDPSGNATVAAAGALSVDFTGTGSITFGGALTTTAPNWTHNGPLHTTGDITSDGTVTGTTDVVGGGKSLKSHEHTDPQGGNTGPPV